MVGLLGYGLIPSRSVHATGGSLVDLMALLLHFSSDAKMAVHIVVNGWHLQIRGERDDIPRTIEQQQQVVFSSCLQPQGYHIRLFGSPVRRPSFSTLCILSHAAVWRPSFCSSNEVLTPAATD